MVNRKRKVRHRARAIIYARGTLAELAEQDAWCFAHIAEHRYELVGVAHDGPGESDAWDDAQRMIRQGEADKLVISSGAKTPDYVESVTGSLNDEPAKRPADRRVRPVRRGGGA